MEKLLFLSLMFLFPLSLLATRGLYLLLVRYG